MDEIPFTKMHGLGNDFIVIRDAEDRYGEALLRDLAETYCRRRTGVGADDLLYLGSHPAADARMRVFEPDGSEADMCGNGIRCAARFLARQGFELPLTVDTAAGTRRVTRDGELYAVSMGAPDFAQSAVVASAGAAPLLEEDWTVDGRTLSVSAVNTGEPHLTVFVDDVAAVDLVDIGRSIRFSDRVPESGVNVNAVEICDRHTAAVRTYERGVEEETPACGTGATAAAVIAARLDRVEPPVTVAMPGGEVVVSRAPGAEAILKGPAAFVYNGYLPVEDDHER